MITRQEELTVLELEKLHTWMLNKEDDLMLTQPLGSPSETTKRIRTITIYSYRHRDFRYSCFIRLSSSPIGEYASSRFKQKFGGDSLLNVKFEFQRMGVPSHLYLHTEHGDQNFEAFGEYQYGTYQDSRYYELLRSLYPYYHEPNMDYYNNFKLDDSHDKNTPSDRHHKIKIQQELFSFREIQQYLEKDLNILGCKFSVLCQNLSGMHSYKYVYFCPALSNVSTPENLAPITIVSVRNWAIPKDRKKELYDEEKKKKLFLRLSLFNTPTIPTVSVDNFKVEEDIGTFTDGCGYFYQTIMFLQHSKYIPCKRNALCKRWII